MTIPGYSYAPKSIQNHIHLGAVNYDGSPPSGFLSLGEPPYQFTVQQRVPVYTIQSEFVRAWDGTPFDHVLRTSDKVSPIVMKSLQYQIRARPQDFDILEHLYARRVYLIDSLHCASNLDHSSFVKIYYFADFKYDDHLEPMLEYQMVNCVFEDMNTVAPV